MKDETEEKLMTLREFVPRGSTVYTICRSVYLKKTEEYISLVVAGNGYLTCLDTLLEQFWPGTYDEEELGFRALGTDRDLGSVLVDKLGLLLYGPDHELRQEWL